MKIATEAVECSSPPFINRSPSVFRTNISPSAARTRKRFAHTSNPVELHGEIEK